MYMNELDQSEFLLNMEVVFKDFTIVALDMLYIESVTFNFSKASTGRRNE